jgi:hypothetical protein
MLCGLGFNLHISNFVSYSFKENAEEGTKNMGELLALFYLLKR